MHIANKETLLVLLDKHARSLPFPISMDQRHKLVDYVCLIHKWNKAYNLTSVRDPEQMLVKHIIDSVIIMPLLTGKRFIDVGTGPGLPGIPLAIMMPDAHFTLLDSLGKRVRFMKQCAHELVLDNIEPVQFRVEDFQPTDLYDGVLSRAFASLKDMLHWCAHLVDSQGQFFALKGQYPQEELQQLGDDYHVEAIHPVQVPDLEGERHLILIRKA